MGVVSLLKARFGLVSGQEFNIPDSEVDKVFVYLKSLLASQAVVGNILADYEEAKNLAGEQRGLACLRVYLDLEKFILGSHPPLITKVFDKPALRRAVAQNVNIQKLVPAFQLLFLPDSEQYIVLFFVILRAWENFLVENMGFASYKYIIEKCFDPSISADLGLTDQGLDSAKITKYLAHTDRANMIEAFRKTYRLLFLEITKNFGDSIALRLISENFNFVKTHYDYAMITKFFELVPRGILADERKNLEITGEEISAKIEQAATAENGKLVLSEDLADRLSKKMGEIEQLNSMLVGRETKVEDLQKEVEVLKNQLTEQQALDAMSAKADKP